MNNRYIRYLFPVVILVSYVLFNHTFINKNEVTLDDFVKWKIEKKKNHKATPGMPDEAMKWYYDQRAYPQGFIPIDWRDKALKKIQENNVLRKTTSTLGWKQLGPGNIGGRIRSIVVHPTNPDIVYLGSVSGGVWKTINGGTNWFPLKDNMENLAVCSIVMDPTNSNILYAGTGEGYNNIDAQRGEGIFKSTDAGATWNRLSSTVNLDFYYVNKLVIDPSTNTLYAATRRGLYKSADGGTTFTSLLSGSEGEDVHCMDVEVAHTSPSSIYASFGLFEQSEIWRSIDGGSTFTKNYTLEGQGRIELATSASNPLFVLASFYDITSQGITNIQQTSDGGNNWSMLGIPTLPYSQAENFAGTQGWYNNILYIDPSNSSILYTGATDFYKSTLGGASWTQKTNWYETNGAGPQMVHADQHAIAFAPSNPNLMFLGTDGGIYKSIDKGENWTAINNDLFITQFTYGAVNPSGTTYYGGTQDNGTLKSTGTANWTTIFGGDGGATEVDFDNPNIVYTEYVNFAFYKSTDAGGNFVKSMNGIPTGPGTYDGTTDRTLFYAPFSMDPNNSNSIVGGTYRVWRTTDGAANWSAISSDLTGDGTGEFGASISTIVIAKRNSNVIYAGTSNGRIQVTTDGGITWNLRNTGLPNAYCTRISIDPFNSHMAYATFSGYLANEKVYRTSDYGITWVNITGNLPNIPVNCVVIDQENTNNVFIGTDLGVFSLTSLGGYWDQLNTGLPNVAVVDLDYRSSDRKIFAATHGRGMFSASLPGGEGTTQVRIIEQNFDTNEFPPAGWFLSTSNTNQTWKLGSITGFNYNSINANNINTAICTYDANYQNESLISPSFALESGDSYLEFFVAHSTAYLANAKIRVQITTDGGANWNKIWESADDDQNLIWRRVIVDLKEYTNNQNINLVWQYEGTDGDVVAIEDIKVVGYQISTDIKNNKNTIPEDYELSQNYPNPFNPSTKINFAIPQSNEVNISVYDITGRKISEVINNYYNAGSHEVTWDGKNSQGSKVASGTYIYRIKAGNFVQSKKMLLLK